MEIIPSLITLMVSTVLPKLGEILFSPCFNDFESCAEGLYKKFRSYILEDFHIEFTSFVEVFFKQASDIGLDDLSEMEYRIMSLIPSEETDRWISDAHDITSDQHGGLKSCCLIFYIYRRYRLISKVKKLLKKGNGIIESQSDKLKLNAVAEMTLKDVMHKLSDDEVGRIGIWGPQQIGKTLVVIALNKKLIESSPDLFSCIIFVPETEKNVNEEYVQKTISKRLKLQVDETMDIEGIADQIRERLKKVKFLLILDHVSKYIDLARIGVPEDRGMSKIVLTSQLEMVCGLMNTTPISMKSLTPTGTGVPVPLVKMKKFAANVKQECGCLPPQLLTNMEKFSILVDYVIKAHGRLPQVLNSMKKIRRLAAYVLQERGRFPQVLFNVEKISKLAAYVMQTHGRKIRKQKCWLLPKAVGKSSGEAVADDKKGCRRALTDVENVGSKAAGGIKQGCRQVLTDVANVSSKAVAGLKQGCGKALTSGGNVSRKAATGVAKGVRNPFSKLRKKK